MNIDEAKNSWNTHKNHLNCEFRFMHIRSA